MNIRILGAAAPLVAALAFAAPAQALEITRAKTEAEARVDASGAPVLQLSLRAELAAVPPDPIVPPEPVVPPEPIKARWEAVGGIEPQPFEVTIPLSCFVEDGGFRVEDPGCGVRVTFDPDGLGAIGLAVDEFEARLVLRGDREQTAVFDIEAVVSDETPLGAMLGALGGTGLEVRLNSVDGPVSAMAVPDEVETIAVPPDPI